MTLLRSFVAGLAAILAFAVGHTAGPALAGWEPPVNEAFGMYSYSDAACNYAVDPVTVIFIHGNGYISHPYNHARRGDHGAWDDKSGGQYFWDPDGCTLSDSSAATEPNWKPSSRWHFRYEGAWTSNGGAAYAATPHRDDFSWTHFTHCVRTYGFTDGRNEIYYKWVYDGNKHPYVYWSYWANDLLIWKCGEYAANWDGWVIYINMQGYDAY
jgi:hypothetical protein